MSRTDAVVQPTRKVCSDTLRDLALAALGRLRHGVFVTFIGTQHFESIPLKSQLLVARNAVFKTAVCTVTIIYNISTTSITNGPFVILVQAPRQQGIEFYVQLVGREKKEDEGKTRKYNVLFTRGVVTGMCIC